MKLKHTFIGILSTCALGLASCDLNITPDSYIADINFYQNEAEVNTAVIGCYGGMHAPLDIEWALTELRSDNTRMNGTRSSNDAFMQPWNDGRQQPEYPHLLGSYLSEYQ